MTGKKKPALCIKIDGIDGSGKTTLAHGLAELYRSKMSVVLTKEFGSLDPAVPEKAIDKSGQLLYELSLNPQFAFDTIEREVCLALASRRQNRLVLTALRHNCDLIFSDRSSLTNYAYSYELGDWYKCFLDWLLSPILIEDWIFLIDSDPKTAFPRRMQSEKHLLGNYKQDTVEQRGLEFQHGVCAQFKRIASQRQNVIALDGSLDKLKLLEAARKHVDSLLA